MLMTFLNNSSVIVSTNHKCTLKFWRVACAEGSYGVDCNLTCGHCLDVNQCSNINGTCLNGCDAGYQGDLCNNGE